MIIYGVLLLVGETHASATIKYFQSDLIFIRFANILQTRKFSLTLSQYWQFIITFELYQRNMCSQNSNIGTYYWLSEQNNLLKFEMFPV